jgi:hypothetical protein
LISTHNSNTVQGLLQLDKISKRSGARGVYTNISDMIISGPGVCENYMQGAAFSFVLQKGGLPPMPEVGEAEEEEKPFRLL